MEDLIFTGLRALHITSGFIALVVAPIAMVVAKGGDAHRRWGKLFFYAMAVVAFTAIVMSFIHPNLSFTFTPISGVEDDEDPARSAHQSQQYFGSGTLGNAVPRSTPGNGIPGLRY